MNGITFYGPIGRAVETVSPYVETDPIGIYATALSMWSAAIGGSVTVASRGNRRPVLLWSALVTGTGRGKGTALRAAEHVMKPALGRFLSTHTTSGITSGASLVNHLWDQQEATMETEAGMDTRCLVVEEEWSECLRRIRRDPSFTGKLRAAWDGAPLRNTTKEEAQCVDRPALVMHTHITPSDWSKYVGAAEAGGGSYNRILPFLLRSVPMLDDEASALPVMDAGDLADAYAWATAKNRTARLADDARPLWQLIRRYARIITESLPAEQAVFVERTAEQALRVAACLAAAECTETIDRECLAAAFSFVRYSVRCTVSITKGSTEPKTSGGRPVMTLGEKVRQRIAMHGGRATSSQLLPYVNATAAEVKALPGITVTSERSGVGRPSTVFTLAEELIPARKEPQAANAPAADRPSSDHSEFSRPRLRGEKNPTATTVVQMDSYRPTPAKAPKAEPVAPPTNPFLALL